MVILAKFLPYERVHSVKPKFHYANFHHNFPARKVVDTNHESCRHKRWQIIKPWSFGKSWWHKSRKSWTQTMSRCLRQSLWQVFDKPVCVILMKFSLLQYMEKISNKVCRHKSRKSATQTIKVSDMIFVSWTFMICVCNKVAKSV